MLKKAILLTAALYAGASNASLITDTSGLGLDVTTLGVSTVGGVVVDLLGANGTHVVSQLAASQLFDGFYDSGTPVAYNGNPGTVGIQTGFNAGTMNALGGGIAGASIRFTLFDGDTALGDFDYNRNTLLINGLDFGSWSAVDAEQTTSTGVTSGSSSGGGFRDNILDTGWFTSTDSVLLTSLFSSLNTTNELLFQIQDLDPYDNYFDFTQGIESSLIDVGQGPVISGPGVTVPEPTSMALIGLGLLTMLRFRRKQ